MNTFLSLLALAAVVAATQIQMEPEIKQFGAVSGWRHVGIPDPSEKHTVIFALKHEPEARAKLDDIFWRVSDPKHKDYGKHLTQEQLGALMAVPDFKIQIVVEFLQLHGVFDFTIVPNRDMIEATIAISTLEKMLGTTFAKFESDEYVEVNRIIAPYHLPAAVAHIVSFVSDLVRFPAWRGPKRQVAAGGNWPDSCGSECSGKVTPQVLRDQYKVPVATTISSNNSMAVAEFQGQEYDYKDLNMFYDACGIPRQTIDNVGGNSELKCERPLTACTEALLDIEYITGLAYPIPLTSYYSSTYSLYNWLKVILNDPNAPWVHSVSYGNDEMQQTSVEYMYSVNDQLQMAGAKGLTIIFASGDQGVWGRDGRGDGIFNPDFPAGSPYVTAVGGSDFATNNIGAETCCSDGGGGFSNTFARPKYQDSAVLGYLSSGVTLPAQKYYNASGRAYPDISAIFGLAIPYCIVSAGRFEGVAGTSASAPVVAAQIALLNDIRLKKKQSVLGFLNPFLYQTLASHPEAFNDITTGINNQGSGEGFRAYAGWDPCSGVGTPNYSVLSQLV